MSEPLAFRISLKVILTDSQGRKLLLYNPADSAGTFDLPGGRINDDEIGLNPLDIIKREIREELGQIEYEIERRPVGYGLGVGKKTGQPTFYLVFEGKYLSGEITLSQEHIKYAWTEDLPVADYANEGLDQAVQGAWN